MVRKAVSELGFAKEARSRSGRKIKVKVALPGASPRASTMRPNSVTVFIALLCTTAVTGQDGVGAALRIGQVVCSRCECCGSGTYGSPCDGPCFDPCLPGEVPDTACTAFVLGDSGAAAACERKLWN